jgi:hypothetical protein
MGVPPGTGPDDVDPQKARRRCFDVLAVVGFASSWVCGMLAGVVCAMALVRIGRTGDRGRGLAVAGLVVSCLWLAALGAATVIAISSGRGPIRLVRAPAHPPATPPATSRGARRSTSGPWCRRLIMATAR